MKHKVEREDIKPFHALEVLWALIKYFLYQAHDAPCQNGSARCIDMLKCYIIGKV